LNETKSVTIPMGRVGFLVSSGETPRRPSEYWIPCLSSFRFSLEQKAKETYFNTATGFYTKKRKKLSVEFSLVDKFKITNGGIEFVVDSTPPTSEG
jgi:hypothetical protein